MGVVLKRLALALLTDRKTLKQLGTVLLVLLLILLMPAAAVAAIFRGALDFDTEAFKDSILNNLSAEDYAFIQKVEATMNAIQAGMEEKGLASRTNEAQVLYILALEKQSEQEEFVARLVGCFQEGQSDSQLIAAVNTAFGTRIDPEDYAKVIRGVRASTVDVSGYINPAGKNNLDLAEWAKAAKRNGWGYVFGTYGTVLTESVLQAKLRQYPEDIGRYEDFIRSHWLGGRTADCVGLIKGYCWYDPASGTMGYGCNGMPDVSADQMYRNAANKGPISTIPNVPGLAVWRTGHIGIYIGNGQVIEAMGTRYGVVQTTLASRDFTHWLQIPYITYIDESEESS